MTLEQLRIFVAVAEREHVTQAARQLNLTQSATSAAIAALESRYGIALFDRIGRNIVLTDTGREFLGEARAVLAQAKAAEQALDDLAGLKRGSLAIVASQTVGNYWLPARLQSFQARYPGIAIDLDISNTEQVAAAVREGSADIGFIEGDIDDAALTIRQIDGDTLIVVVGMAHPWAKARKVTPRMLPQSGWIMRESGSGTRSIFESGLRGLGIAPADLPVRLTLPSTEAIRAAVEAGDCAAAMSNLVAEASIAAKRLHHVGLTLPRRAFSVLRHKGRRASQAEQAFLRLVGAG